MALSIDNLCQIALSTILSSKKILLCGNGGSASDASHIAAEFIGKFQKDRRPLPAISLTDNLSTITSISNDYCFEEVFSRQIMGIGKQSDLLIALSTSGNSQNVVKAIETANNIGINCFALTGKDGGEVLKYSNVSIHIKSKKTSHIQESQLIILHLICEFLEDL